MRKPLFLDRDGVLNVDVAPYVTHIRFLKIFPYTVPTLKRLHEAGFDFYVVSNQQGIAKGIIPPEQLELVTQAFQEACRQEGFEIKKFYYCTAMKGENHAWRKPSPGMIESAVQEFSLDISNAFLIGDKWSDIEAAHRGKLRPLLVYSGVTSPGQETEWTYPAEAAFPTLVEAAEFVMENG